MSVRNKAAGGTRIASFTVSSVERDLINTVKKKILPSEGFDRDTELVETETAGSGN